MLNITMSSCLVLRCHPELVSGSKERNQTMKTYYVYIKTNSKNHSLYIGVTSDLLKRTFEHKKHLVQGFTDKYNITKLVYFEQTNSITSAITREKQLKNWHRQWKNNLIETMNPNWNDLYNELIRS